MSGTPPRALGDLLPGALPQLGDRLVEHRLRRAWSSVVGPDLARRSRPCALGAGTLTITVDNSPWLHELTLRADALRVRIADRFPEVRSLRFVLGGLDAERGEDRERRPSPAALTEAALTEVDRT